jgi:DNA-binding XRE family transcriptional regulator
MSDITREEFKTTNLLLASLLEASGATITNIEIGKKFSTITLDVPSYCKDSLSNKVERLGRVIGRLESVDEWKDLFASTVLGDMEDKYVRLKRKITRSKEK